MPRRPFARDSSSVSFGGASAPASLSDFCVLCSACHGPLETKSSGDIAHASTRSQKARGAPKLVIQHVLCTRACVLRFTRAVRVRVCSGGLVVLSRVPLLRPRRPSPPRPCRRRASSPCSFLECSSSMREAHARAWPVLLRFEVSNEEKRRRRRRRCAKKKTGMHCC